MKASRFRLDRVLDWRRTELEMEESRLRNLYAALAAIDRERAALQSTLAAAAGATVASASLDAADLHALAEYRAAARIRSDRLAQLRRAREAEIAGQQQKLLEARRRCRLLENLKSRRLAEWQQDSARQAETDAPPHRAKM
jgi:flagellar export protein FliJ